MTSVVQALPVTSVVQKVTNILSLTTYQYGSIRSLLCITLRHKSKVRNMEKAKRTMQSSVITLQIGLIIVSLSP